MGDKDSGHVQLTELFTLCDPENDTEEEILSIFDFSKRYYENEGDFHNKDVFLDTILRSGLELDEMDETVREASASSLHQPVYPELKDRTILNLEMDENPRKYVRGILKIENGNLAFCEPLDGSDEVIIYGRSSAGQTFTDDEVIVELINQNESIEKKTESGEDGMNIYQTELNQDQMDFHAKSLSKNSPSCRYGHVVYIESRSRFHDVKHPVFLCTMSTQSKLMAPMCKTVPKVYIMTSTKDNDGIDVYRYQIEDKSLTKHYDKEFSRKERLQNIFVVVVLNWDKRRQYPIGVVLDVLEFGNDEENYGNLTDRLHGIPTIYSEEAIKETEKIMQNPDNGSTDNCIRVFTIDNANSLCLDDAFSVENLSELKWRIGIHITDVTSVIEKDSSLDIQARELVETQYQGRRTSKQPVHMLPEPLSTDRLSLIPNKKRQAISFFVQMEKHEDAIKWIVQDLRVQSVVSKRKFSYKEVDNILASDKKEDPYFSKLYALYMLSTELKENRLGAHVDISLHTAEGEIDNTGSLQSKSIVEELMIFTNYNTARTLLNFYKDCIPLRVQNIPAQDKLNRWLVDHQYIKDIVFSLQNQIVSLDEFIPYRSNMNRHCLGVLYLSPRVNVPDEEMVRIRRDLWVKLVAASEATDEEGNNVSTSYLESLLKDDGRYPYQNRAYLEWCSFQSKALYQCSDNVNLNSSQGRHFSLAVHPYTHFTSPLRRYIDLVNHRLLHAAMKKETKPYIKEEVRKLCEKANGKKRILANYRREVDNFPVVRKLFHSPKMFEAYISSFTQNTLCLTIPYFYGKDIRRTELTLDIPFRLLQLAKEPEEIKDYRLNYKGSTTFEFNWDRKVYPAPGTEFLTESAYMRSCRFIPIKEWQKILKCLLVKCFDGVREIVKKWKDIFEQCDVGDDSMLSQIIQIDDRTRHYFFRDEEHDSDEKLKPFRVSLKLHEDQVVKLQVVSQIERGHQVPMPQYLSINKHLCFCIEHNRDPVEIFCGYATSRTETRYDDVDDYIARWLPIMEMESVYGAVTEKGPITIHGIDYTVQPNAGHFSLPAEYCLYHGIDLTSSNLDVINKIGNDSAVASANYLCIRCNINGLADLQGLSSQWIAHAKIKTIRENKVTIGERSEVESYHVEFRLLYSTDNDRYGNIKGGTIELIQKSIVERRQETIIKRHLETSPDLAVNVALGDAAPKLDQSIFIQAHFAGTDIALPGLARNNEDQHRAIRKALTNSFSLIQGPPGTGKTVTGIKLLCLLNRLNKRVFLDGQQIVFCGPSNKSVDNVARWMTERLLPELDGENEIKIIRLYGKSFVYQDFPVPSQFNFITPGKVMKKTDETLKQANKVLHYVIRQENKQYAVRLRAFDDRFSRAPADVTLSEFLEYEDIHSKAEQDELKNYDIIFCTVSMTSNPKLIKATKGRIQQCIIDECGMCTEPETLVPIIALQPEQVVLIGDHKQLQPIIRCREAAHMGLKKSLFERYHDKSLHAPRTMLTLQYRMNPHICKFPSEEFYGGKLRTDPDNRKSWKVNSPLSIWKKNHSVEQHIPLAFFHVEGREESLVVSTDRGHEHSKSNKAEVDTVLKIIKYFDREGVPLSDVNVMSQYNAQCSLLRDRIRENNIPKVNVNTVVSSQGGEWDYVIFSTTRSLPRHLIQQNPTTDWRLRNLGFIVDQHQINVALTRARKGLVIVGNKHLLKADRVWGKLIEFYRVNGCIYKHDSALNP